MSEKRKSPIEQLAEQLIEGMKKNDALFVKDWEAGRFRLPVNAASGRPYNGINMLALLCEDKADPRFCTLKQANNKGWRVGKGEKSRPVVFWKFEKKEAARDANGDLIFDDNGQQKIETTQRDIPFASIAHVFHVSQLHGDIPDYAPAPITWNPNERAETILQNSKVKLVHDQRDAAYYSLREDAIHLTPKGQFQDESKYYAAALHELAHATGHAGRLNRPHSPFGSPEYAREEIRAEIASMLLCAELGLGYAQENNQAYINNYMTLLEKNPYEIVNACKDADKIKEMVMGFELTKALAQKNTLASEPKKIAAKVLPEEKTAIAKEKTWLSVSYFPETGRLAAKAAGARWDKEARSWYAPIGANLDALTPWLTTKMHKSQAEFPKPLSPQQEFAERLHEAGLLLDGLPIMDGQLHRVPVIREGKEHSNKDGAYKGYLDGRPAGYYENHYTGEKDNWKSTGVQLSQEQIRQLRETAARKAEQAHMDRLATQEQAARRCYAIWQNADQAESTHPYLQKKGVPSHDLKVDQQGCLLIAGHDASGFLHTLQTITPDGKFFAKGARKEGTFYIIDPKKEFESKPIQLVEGYATGASVHALTGNPVVCAFDAGNLIHVAQALRDKHPEKQITIFADNDLRHPQNPGISKANAAAELIGNAKVYAPNFTEEEVKLGLSDWNDVCSTHDLKTARKKLALAKQQEKSKASKQEKPGVNMGLGLTR